MVSNKKRFGYKKIQCEICDKVIYVRNSYFTNRNRRFCSNGCRNNYFASLVKIKECPICQKEFKDKKGGHQKYCSKKCYIKYQRIISKTIQHSFNSYVNSKDKDGNRIREHRLVIEKKIGKKLNKNKVVHHIDGNRSNNAKNNLKLMTQSEHIKIHFKNLW